MKRVLAILLLMTMVFSVLAGCTKEPGTTEPAATTAAAAGETTAAAVEPVKILNLINGTLGDMSFFDSSERGMQAIAAKYGDKVQVKTIEMSLDQTKWQPTLEDEVGGDWDVIIVGTWQMVDMLQKVAPENPEKNFIIYDSSVDYAAGDFKNVYSITFKQNEGSYLAGALAAKLSTTQKIGFLGGMDIPVINDFLVGYIEGAKSVSPDVKVAVSYIGSFGDSAKGKEMAAAQYSQGVDIGFNVAGQAGLGQIDAARDAKKLAIGVDSDQAMLFATSDPEKAAVIPTSMLKNIDQVLIRAIDLYMEGKMPVGQAESLGMKENAVGLADNEFFKKLVSPEIQTYINDLKTKIMNGEITVSTAFGMDQAKLDEVRASVKP